MTSKERKEIEEKVKSALFHVGPEYYSIPSLHGKVLHSERAFAYEFYHQLRLQFVSSRHYVNGELRKSMALIPLSESNDVYIPDLVLHHHSNLDLNIMAIEIKTNPTISAAGLIGDLKKLESLTNPNSGLKYYMGLMLVVNSNIEEKINSMREENREKIFKYLEYSRLRIWNVTSPSFTEKSGNKVKLKTGFYEFKSPTDFKKNQHA